MRPLPGMVWGPNVTPAVRAAPQAAVVAHAGSLIPWGPSPGSAT